jgi:hypothetical protein
MGCQSFSSRLMLDLGSEKLITSTKISFYNFHLDRIYEYSIQVSADSLNWVEVVLNNYSITDEWTVNNFFPAEARFIKLLCISSTNNPGNWANVWEFEVYGIEEALPVELSS